MLVSTFVLLSISSLFVAAEIYSYRTSLQDETAALASSLASNCKKLLLANRYNEAAEVLSSLQFQPNIRAAYLFDEHGKPVAEYLDQSDSKFLFKTIPLDFPGNKLELWTVVGETQLSTTWNHLSLFMPIDHGNRHIGVIYLLSDLHGLYGQLSGVVYGSLLLLGVMLACSWFLAGLLQRPISVPLLRLVSTMQSISQQQDYSLRAEKDEQDEIGVLVDGFNRTLDQIELHQAELAEHKESLELTVELRTGELRKMVTALEAAKGQAETANEAKSQFLANITHELRTPLIGVLGMNELLFKTRLDDQQQMLAETVQKSGENLLLLINDVLDFSKIEAGELRLDEQEFYLHRAVEDVLGLLAGQAADKGLALYADIDKAATWKVLGDEVRVRQILMNLVGNALKFTEQGSVTVKLSAHQEATDSAEFIFEVIDTGAGLADVAQQRIFSAFYQADDSNTREHSGTGLGLAIVRQLVELFQGTICVDSQPGVGSCFRVSFCLPLIEPCDFFLPENLLQQKVLLHVADRAAQQLLAFQLQSLGLAVVEADSAADILYQLGFAQRHAQTFAMALIAADLTLPGGQLLYTAIRENPSQSALRRILLLGRKDRVTLHKQEQKLYLPVGWTDLHATLCRCRHELHLVDLSKNIQLEPFAVQTEAGLPEILLVGGNVASRELIKLALASLPVRVMVAINVEQCDEKVSQQIYAAVLLDLTSLPIEQFIACRKKQAAFPEIFALYTANDAIAELESLTTGVLEKPVSREALAQLLQPILADGRKTLSPVKGSGS